MEWSSRITTISLELVVPPLAGYWLDQRFGTGMLILIVGAVLGFVTATYSLIRLVKSQPSPRNTAKPRNRTQH